MNKNHLTKIVTGAILGTLLGAGGAALFPKRRKILCQMKNHSKDWSDRARDVGETVLQGVRNWSQPERSFDAGTFISSALLGLLVGAGAALLLAPKSGKQFRRDLSDTYDDLSDKTQEIYEFLSNHDVVPKHKPSIKRDIKRPVAHAVKKARAKVKSHK